MGGYSRLVRICRRRRSAMYLVARRCGGSMNGLRGLPVFGGRGDLARVGFAVGHVGLAGVVLDAFGLLDFGVEVGGVADAFGIGADLGFVEGDHVLDSGAKGLEEAAAFGAVDRGFLLDGIAGSRVHGGESSSYK